MFWKSRNNSITISAELHDKLLRTSPLINEVDSEVLGVRRVPSHQKNPHAMDPIARLDDCHMVIDDIDEKSPSTEYHGGWSWYR